MRTQQITCDQCGKAIPPFSVSLVTMAIRALNHRMPKAAFEATSDLDATLDFCNPTCAKVWIGAHL